MGQEASGESGKLRETVIPDRYHKRWQPSTGSRGTMMIRTIERQLRELISQHAQSDQERGVRQGCGIVLGITAARVNEKLRFVSYASSQRM